jgi:hypothetical protein
MSAGQGAESVRKPGLRFSLEAQRGRTALMLLMILERGDTIRAQQMLIRQLYPNSLELTSAKLRQAQQAHR